VLEKPIRVKKFERFTIGRSRQIDLRIKLLEERKTARLQIRYVCKAASLFLCLNFFGNKFKSKRITGKVTTVERTDYSMRGKRTSNLP